MVRMPNNSWKSNGQKKHKTIRSANGGSQRCAQPKLHMHSGMLVEAKTRPLFGNEKRWDEQYESSILSMEHRGQLVNLLKMLRAKSGHTREMYHMYHMYLHAPPLRSAHRLTLSPAPAFHVLAEHRWQKTPNSTFAARGEIL